MNKPKICSKINISEISKSKNSLYDNLSKIIEKNVCGIIILDKERKIRFVNPSVEKIFNRNSEELIGNFFEFNIKVGHSQKFEIEDKVIEIHSTDFEWNGEKAILANLLDISKRAKAEKELQRSNKELDNFATVASHDMYEPLNKILGLSEDIPEKHQIDIRAKKKIQKISSSAKHLQDLLESILQFSRVTSRAKAFERVNLNETVNEILCDFDKRIKESGAQINCEDLPYVEADPIQMRQVFQNLISNAIKFRKEDQEPIISIESKKLSNGIFQISVKDNGIGFNPKYANQIFKQFERLNYKNKYEGNGVGLAICKRIIERHGGEITAYSEPGKGSEFIITVKEPGFLSTELSLIKYDSEQNQPRPTEVF